MPVTVTETTNTTLFCICSLGTGVGTASLPNCQFPIHQKRVNMSLVLR